MRALSCERAIWKTPHGNITLSFNTTWNHYKILKVSDDFSDIKKKHREKMVEAVAINKLNRTNVQICYNPKVAILDSFTNKLVFIIWWLLANSFGSLVYSPVKCNYRFWYSLQIPSVPVLDINNDYSLHGWNSSKLDSLI